MFEATNIADGTGWSADKAELKAKLKAVKETARNKQFLIYGAGGLALGLVLAFAYTKMKG